MTAEELKAWMDENPRLQILDVREPFEVQISRIDGVTLIPLGELPKRYTELDPSRDLVVHCKVGGRSAKAVSFLRGPRLPAGDQPQGRHPRLERPGRPVAAASIEAAPTRRPGMVVLATHCRTRRPARPFPDATSGEVR